MIPALPLPDEEERLAALFRQQILDSPEETEFNEIVELASRLLGTKISLISLVDDHRQWFKAKVGLAAAETPKAIAFCSHAIHGDDIFEVPNALDDLRFFDNPLVTGDPHIRFYAGQPLQSDDGYKLGTLCVIDDHPRKLTADQQQILRVLGRQVEKQLELRLQLYKQKISAQIIQSQLETLSELNQIKDQLLGVLSHDLQNPLVMLSGVMELFDLDSIQPEEIVELMQEVRQKILQTKAQLGQVLQWSQQQIMRQSVVLKTFMVAAIAEDALIWVKDQAHKKQVELGIDVDPDLQAQGDTDLVNLVLRNLLSNAVKYSCRGDRVTVFARQEADKIRLGVADTGLGMTPHTLQKLRDRTYQLSTPGTDNELGTGLGLLLCQTYLNKMNTRLHIESEWKKGSSFSFLLAIAPPS